MKILNACLVAAFCLCASSAMAVDNTDSTVAAGAGAGVKAATETMGAKAGEATVAKKSVGRLSCFTDKDLALNNTSVLVSAPVSLPARLLSVPYTGMEAAQRGIAKIESDAGRVALQVVAAPLWVPAFILNIPSTILFATGVLPPVIF